MKILFLAWAPYDDAEKRMGGIRVYMHDLVREVAKQGNDVFCLSTGYLFSPLSSKTWVEKDKSVDPAIENYVVVNSGVIAPAMFIENNFTDVLAHAPTERAVLTFLEKHGPFDVVHIQSMEGLPYSILGLIKERFPKTKIIYSLHHYHDLCPKVDLFREKRGVHCTDYEGGRACVGCYQFDYNSLRKKYFMDYVARKVGIRSRVSYGRMVAVAKMIWRVTTKLRAARRALKVATAAPNTSADHFFIFDPKTVQSYRNRREQLRAMLEKNIDLFIPVSERTMLVYEQHGYDISRFRPQHIGTQAADRLVNGQPEKTSSGESDVFRLCYMGYPSKLKGFEVFVSALSLLPLDISAKISVVIAGRVTDKYLPQLGRIGKRFHAVEVFNGYTRADQDRILAGVDLGVVPPQWEDNLPQVAFEFYCHGVPFICSDLGGMQELIKGGEDLFVFKHDRPAELAAKIAALVKNRELLDSFWTHGTSVKNIKDHTAHVVEMYREQTVA